MDAVCGAEPAAVSAAVRILPFSGESTATASLPSETIIINFIRNEVRHDGRRPNFKVAGFFFSGLDGEALPVADESNSRIMSHFRF